MCAAKSSTIHRRGSIYDATVAGLYDLEKTIGKGHFAVVKLARHVFTGEKVAVKVIDKNKLDPVSREHLFQEVRCMKLVQHPNIVRLYEVIDTQTKLFLILELGDYDMYEYIMRYSDKGVNEEEAQRYFAQIVHAISYCHKLHVVHRDLKPENVVFFEHMGMVKLTDFGFSNLFSPGQKLETSCGSLAYSAPEILLGDSYDAPAIDVWSLGVILFMLVCGRLPFQEANDSETLTKILDCSFALPAHLSDSCKLLISRMLVRDPAHRATLEEIEGTPWVAAGNMNHALYLPLVSPDHLSEEDHSQIVGQMVDGGIATAEEILRVLEADEYSYVSATYYLLAERMLRKERQAQAKKLYSTCTRSDSQLQLASLALSPRIKEKTIGNIVVACTCHDPSNKCACVQSKLAHEKLLEAQHRVEGLVSPMSKQAVSGALDLAQDVLMEEDTTGKGRWPRSRHCSIVREESDEEPSHVRSRAGTGSRTGSRSSSPSNTPRRNSSSSSLKELEELQRLVTIESSSAPAVIVTGPQRSAGSRSPSPGGGRASPVVIKYKSLPTPARKIQSVYSSPHLVEICEEREVEEDDELDLPGGSSTLMRRSGDCLQQQTYSCVRAIRPRQAVVSPDVIRRYERGRSKRSTSCSSSEASDDDNTDKRFHLITRSCRRDSDPDDDMDPPAAGTGGENPDAAHGTGRTTGTRSHLNGHGSGNGVSAQGNATGGSSRKMLDPRKLACRLQRLALAPIREVPHWFITRARALRLVGGVTDRPAVAQESEDALWYKQLDKPRSCERLYATTAVVDATSSAATAKKSPSPTRDAPLWRNPPNALTSHEQHENFHGLQPTSVVAPRCMRRHRHHGAPKKRQQSSNKADIFEGRRSARQVLTLVSGSCDHTGRRHR